MVEAYEAFLAAFPEYASTRVLDALRATEYRRLDEQQHVYLDYTGGSLHAESQVLRHAALLNEHVFGNPHSASPSSVGMTNLVEQARRAVLDWFNASADEYTAVFTANATGALKHVGESYPFAPGGRLLLTVDNHNSVNGIREFARAKGAPRSSTCRSRCPSFGSTWTRLGARDPPRAPTAETLSIPTQTRRAVCLPSPRSRISAA